MSTIQRPQSVPSSDDDPLRTLLDTQQQISTFIYLAYLTEKKKARRATVQLAELGPDTTDDERGMTEAERERARVERCAREFERLSDLMPLGVGTSSLPPGVRDLIHWLANQIPVADGPRPRRRAR